LISDKKQTRLIQVNTEIRSHFREAIRLFLLDCRFRNLSSETIRGYYNHLHEFQLDMEKWEIPLLGIQRRDITHRMVLYMLQSGYATGTINGRLRSCQQFFKFLFHEGIYANNISADIKPIKNPRRMLHTFTSEQLQLLLKLPDRSTFKGSRDYAIMLVFLDTGIRVSELSLIKQVDIFPEDNYIIIRHGKGNKSRTVPIQRTCREALEHYSHLRSKFDTDYFWVTRQNEPFLKAGIIDMVSLYIRQAGITGLIGSTHLFRHTMAKMFLLNGGDMFTLQNILGHTTLEMTRYYVELFSQDIHKQHAAYSPVENLSKEFSESAVFKP
jgi:integrase/recombinase XerD